MPQNALNSGLGIVVICPDKIKLINLSFSKLFCLCGVAPQVLSSIGWSIIQNGSGISRSGCNIVGFRLHFGGISKKIYGYTADKKVNWKSTIKRANEMMHFYDKLMPFCISNQRTCPSQGQHFNTVRNEKYQSALNRNRGLWECWFRNFIW